MRLWVIIIVAYALMTFGCETDKSQKLGGTSQEQSKIFIGYEDYGLTSD